MSKLVIYATICLVIGILLAFYSEGQALVVSIWACTCFILLGMSELK